MNLNIPYIVTKIAEHGTEDDFVATDVGQHQMWTAQHYPFKKSNKFLTSGGLGTMGYGMGAAFGAGVANRDKRIILITGDGSFRMNFNEVITAVRNKVPIKIFLMNNRTLGMVRQWQNLFYEERYSGTELSDDINYLEFASSMGAKGYRVNQVSELDAAIKDAFSNDKVCIIECNVATEFNVYPMVPPGKAIDEAINE